MTEQDAVAADELKRLCQQLVHKAQFKSMRSFVAGSSVETTNNHLSMRALGLKIDNEDVDHMFYLIDLYAFPLTQRVPVEYNGRVLRVYSHGLHPGYARLINERSGEEQKHFHCSRLGRYNKICGPAERYRKLDFIKENLEHVNIVVDNMLYTFLPIMDGVRAIHSPYWPVEASEWISRPRRHACPSKSVIKQVVRYGCDFVGVAHKLSSRRENDEWRFSFSMAELIIIRRWTSSQRIAYRVLRLVYKLIAQKAAEENKETVLCTYYFKTLMLWACEERPKEFWAEHSLVHSIQQLIIVMADWLRSKICCSYFIRENNMMDHLVNTDVSRDVADLYEASAARNLVAHMTTSCAADELFSNTLTLRSDLPTWIHRAILICDRVFKNSDIYRDLGSNDFSLYLQTALIQELTDVYRGLACHREAVVLEAVRDKCMRRAESHFTAAARLHLRTERAILDITPATYELITTFFSAYDADYKVSSTRAAQSVTEKCALHCGCKAVLCIKSAHFKDVLYSRTITKQSNHRHKSIMPALSLVVYWLSELQGVKCVRQFHFYQNWPGHSPSVNVSWFIAKAYLANLYYTQRHYKAAIEMCNDVVGIYKHSWSIN